MSLVINNVVICFSLIFLGFYLGKREIVRNLCASDLSNLIVKVTLPATVFISMLRPFEQSLITDGIIIFFLICIFEFFCLGIGFAVVKLFKIPSEQSGAWILACAFSNNGFLGFPLASAIYGYEGLFLLAIANIVTNFLIFSLGIKLITKGQDIKLKGRQVIYNNVNICVALGILFFFTGWRLPETPMTIIDYIASMTVPVSMLVVGLSMSKSNILDMFKDRKLYALCTVRLLLIPAATILFTKCIPFRSDSLVPDILILNSLLPAASAISILSEQYGAEAGTPAKIIFLTTIMSLVTIPLVMFFA